MSKRIPTGITRNYLESVALPNHGGRYTPISHKSIIDQVHAELATRGFNVEIELYRANVHGNVANGMYILDQGTDPDMKMMFAWGNSYDKSMRFKCGIGVYIPKTGNYIFHGNLANYARKHTGTADQDALEMIQTHLNMANAHYTELLDARDKLINSSVSVRQASELVGRMFIEEQCINKEQASSIRDRIINEVQLFDNLSWDNAWNFYNSVATAVRMSHPKSWFEDQSKIHGLIITELTNTSPVEIVAEVTTEPVDANQLDIFSVITQLESDTDVILDDIPEDLFHTQPVESLPAHIADLPEEVQEEIYVDDILQQKTFEGKVNPDEEFFNFGDTQLPTFDLPDL
jgi:hypothetical protein